MSDDATRIDLERLKHFIPFDSLSDSHLAEIRERIHVLHLPPARLVFKRGQPAGQAMFLVQGAVDITDASFQVRPFPADDDENYLALDNYPEHTVNAITTEPSTFYLLERNHLDLLMTWTQAAESMLEEGDDDRQSDWMDALLGSELFAQVPPTRIQSLFARFEERTCHLGEEVVREGDGGDTFYVIKQGKAMVTRRQGGREDTLAALTAGSFFGEDALISDAPRNATVTMTSDGILMCLGKEDFRDILQQSVVRRVSSDELDALNEDGDRACVLIDVRLPMEFRHDRTPGARNIPLTELRRELRSLEKDFIYVVSCDGGRRSELGAYLLSEAGFDAFVLERQSAPPESAAS
ncbi:cAMP-dependent protein kinase regulatory chain [Alcanivorax sp. S71-1-4]|uniref:cyclic nucleotide-binding domain-containing protein n=1 Tax=Alcanivorax sp. S71-1-4 TaxID=1177159 RepID=UPI001356FA6A|nr:cyclic nucleotide-binding domain-containing protein [Alcanivorax sp. S71-1-4]KAF0809766.1 cAMP-dependent protein kinase regulatory chain [Alcanivorax sp. S71-1-4]